MLDCGLRGLSRPRRHERDDAPGPSGPPHVAAGGEPGVRVTGGAGTEVTHPRRVDADGVELRACRGREVDRPAFAFGADEARGEARGDVGPDDEAARADA